MACSQGRKPLVREQKRLSPVGATVGVVLTFAPTGLLIQWVGFNQGLAPLARCRRPYRG